MRKSHGRERRVDFDLMLALGQEEMVFLKLNSLLNLLPLRSNK
jgi:hypothetical protein